MINNKKEPYKDLYEMSYTDAREKFLNLCAGLNLKVDHHQHPELGINGENLYCDTALLGSKDAQRLLIVIAGTHGAEGFCGSMIINEFLEEWPKTTPIDNTAILFIHGLNPYGFSHIRRTDSENIDVNRNFVFSEPFNFKNEGYDKLHKSLCPKDWNSSQKYFSDLRLLWYAQKLGIQEVQKTITEGQYSHQDGLFFGGKNPSWSQRILFKVLKKYGQDKTHIACVDIHTGLGKFGHSEVISNAAFGSSQYLRTKDWFKDFRVTFPDLNNSVSSPLKGDITDAIESYFMDKNVTAVTLEFGTYDTMRVLEALRADNWLSTQSDEPQSLDDPIKKEMKEVFFPDNQDWRHRVTATGIKAITQCLKRVSLEI